MKRNQKINHIPIRGSDELTPEDSVVFYDAETQSMSRATARDFVNQVAGDNQGYFGLLTNFYFAGGVATTTELETEDTDQWVDVNFTVDTQGTFDKRPYDMTQALADPFDDATGIFNIEGLSQDSSVSFRASMTFEPDEDEGELQARLLFNRHSGASPSEDFSIEDVALSMSQGADLEYPAEPLLTFFVGDTIDTNGPGDAGQCRFQVKTTVPGTIRMRALTWFINS